MNFRQSRKREVPDMQGVFDYACFLLAQRSYSRAELLAKFSARYFAAEKIFAEVLAKLAKLGLQSDESFAEVFVRTHAHWGRQRIFLELKKRGIAADLIEAFLPAEFSEIENARVVLVRNLQGKKLPTDFLTRQKLAAFLARRGFSAEVVREVIF